MNKVFVKSSGLEAESSRLKINSSFVLINKDLKVRGMAIWPFIIWGDEKYRADKVLLNHELIHHKQQLELLIIPFYFLYLLNYLINLLIYKNHDKAYTQIIFEQEAYDNDTDLSYLQKRKIFAWLKYVVNNRNS